MKCKICNKLFIGKIGLNTHIRNHKISIISYFIKYEMLEIPKCECGKNKKQKGNEIKFLSTCGNKICIKKIQREKRLDYMKNNPDKTAWRLKNLSYPEKVFKKKCEELNLNEKYLIIRERPVFPYFIDFAFENEKIAIEIDGSQHENEDRKKEDKKKDKLLLKNGWKILRFPATNIINNIDECMSLILKFIVNKEKQYEKIGIFEWIQIKQKFKDELNKQRENNNGLTDFELKRAISQRIVNRPDFKTLILEIENNGYVGTGKKYGVSDNAIRGWVKTYKKYNK